jgi:hypothetical protein
MALVGQHDAPAGATDELDPELALERLQLLRHGAGRPVRRGRDGGDAAAVGELPQQVEVGEVHEGSLQRPRGDLRWS